MASFNKCQRFRFSVRRVRAALLPAWLMVSPTPRTLFVCVCVTVGLLNTKKREFSKWWLDVLCNKAVSGLMDGSGCAFFSVLLKNKKKTHSCTSPWTFNIARWKMIFRSEPSLKQNCQHDTGTFCFPNSDSELLKGVSDRTVRELVFLCLRLIHIYQKKRKKQVFLYDKFCLAA